MTNYHRIQTMSEDELAVFLTERGGWGCLACSENKIDYDESLPTLELLRNEPCDGQCAKHCREWLSKKIEDAAEECLASMSTTEQVMDCVEYEVEFPFVSDSPELPDWQARLLKTFGGDAHDICQNRITVSTRGCRSRVSVYWQRMADLLASFTSTKSVNGKDTTLTASNC